MPQDMIKVSVQDPVKILRDSADYEPVRIKMPEASRILLQAYINGVQTSMGRVAAFGNFAVAYNDKLMAEIFGTPESLKRVAEADTCFVMINQILEGLVDYKDVRPTWKRRMQKELDNYEQKVRELNGEDFGGHWSEIKDCMMYKLYDKQEQAERSVKISRHVELMYKTFKKLEDMVKSAQVEYNERTEQLIKMGDALSDAMHTFDTWIVGSGHKDREAAGLRVFECSNDLITVYEGLDSANHDLSVMVSRLFERTVEADEIKDMKARLDLKRRELGIVDARHSELDRKIGNIRTTGFARAAKRAKSPDLEKFFSDVYAIDSVMELESVKSSAGLIAQSLLMTGGEKYGLKTGSEVEQALYGINTLRLIDISVLDELRSTKARMDELEAEIAGIESSIASTHSAAEKRINGLQEQAEKAKERAESLATEARLYETAISDLAYKIYRIKLSFG